MAPTVDVTEHGAAGDGRVETAALQAAVDACAEADGGTVAVPPGTYGVAALDLRSGVTLDLSPGATLRASPDPDDFGDGGDLSAVLRARDATDVAVVGGGTIDGNDGAYIREEPLDPATDPAIETAPDAAGTRQGADYFAARDTVDGPLAFAPDRPSRVVLFDGCTDVTLRDVTLRGAPCWTVHLRDCDGALVEGIAVRNDRRVPNSDGIVPHSSRDVRIADCTIRTGDDAISPKATADYGPCENVTVTNCTLASRSGAVKLGGETEAPIRDVVVTGVVIRDSNRGLALAHRDGGDVENVLFSDVTVETRLHTGNWWGQAEPIHLSSLPRREGAPLGAVRNIRFSNVVARGEGGALVWNHPDSTVEDVAFDRVRLRVERGEHTAAVGGNVDLRATGVRTPLFGHDVPALHCREVGDLSLADVRVRWGDDPPDYHANAVRCVGCEGVELAGVAGRQPDDAGAAVRLEDVAGATVRDCRAAAGTDTFLALRDTRDDRLLVDNDLGAAERAVDGDAGSFERAGNRLP